MRDAIKRFSGAATLLFAVALAAPAAFALSPDRILLLQDAAGWRLHSISDVDNGFPTNHVCFNAPVQGACSGNMHFAPGKTFTEDMTAHGKTSHRHGTYELGDDTLTFFDEFNNKDGPYSVVIDTGLGQLTLETVQAGVKVRMVLLSAKPPAK